MSRENAARAADYVLARVRELSGPRWYQGPRPTKLPLDGLLSAEPLEYFAAHRLRGVGELEARGLVGWANDTRSAELFDREITAREIIELQAEGRRCVALLPDAPPADGLEFALHDLRHLEKFFEPAHHRVQIGFFRLFARALSRPDYLQLDQSLDETWCNERDKTLADMNGSPIFLFGVLKMKLKVAVRRSLARARGVAPPLRSALDADELAAYAPVLERFLDVLGFEGPVREAAREISTRRDRPHFGQTLLAHFAET